MEILFFFAIFCISLLGLQLSLWILFEQNEVPGWKSLIPIYQLFILNQIAGKDPSENWKWFVPCYNVWHFYQVNQSLCQRYQKSWEFSLGLTIFSWAFYPLLAVNVVEWMEKSVYANFCGPLPLFGPANKQEQQARSAA